MASHVIAMGNLLPNIVVRKVGKIIYCCGGHGERLFLKPNSIHSYSSLTSQGGPLEVKLQFTHVTLFCSIRVEIQKVILVLVIPVVGLVSDPTDIGPTVLRPEIYKSMASS